MRLLGNIVSLCASLVPRGGLISFTRHAQATTLPGLQAVLAGTILGMIFLILLVVQDLCWVDTMKLDLLAVLFSTAPVCSEIGQPHYLGWLFPLMLGWLGLCGSLECS